MNSDFLSERWAFVSTESAGRRELRLACAVILASVLVFAVFAPFAKTPLAQYPVFIPVYVTSLVISDLITATLLFGQFNVLRSTPVLILATGYLFTAAITGAYALIFPGLFSETGWFGSGPQTSSVMYMVWHGGFPLIVIAYVLTKRLTPATFAMGALLNRCSVRAAIVCAIVLVLMLTMGAVLLATADHVSMPLLLQGNRTTPLGRGILTAIWLLSLLALVLLWWRKPHTVLDIWLLVVMVVWLADIALSAILNTGRYDLGWYAGRIYGVLAASALLIVLLLGDIRHYARLLQMSVDLKIANRNLASLSRQDALTRLANRRWFDEYLAEQLSVAHRHGRPLSLILCDVDHFKAFNDQYGHPAGDACLASVAAILQKCCQRPADLAARYGGEEFAIILPDTGMVHAVQLAEKIRATVAGAEFCSVVGAAPQRISISCGVAALRAEMTAEHMIGEADRALYQAKSAGRNCVVGATEPCNPAGFDQER